MNIVIQASSAGNLGGDYAKITINGTAIDVERNEHNHYRGLHVVVINPLDYKVEVAKVFDTYITSDSLNAFIEGGIT